MSWPDARREVRQEHAAMLAKLREATQMPGRSVVKLAMLLGRSQSAASKLLHGHLELTPEMLETISAAFGMASKPTIDMLAVLWRTRHYGQRARPMLHRPGSAGFYRYHRMGHNEKHVDMVIVGEVPDRELFNDRQQYRLVMPIGVAHATEENRASTSELAKQPNVQIHVIEREARASLPPANYAVYGSKLAMTDTFAGVIMMTDKRDVHDHAARFTLLWAIAEPLPAGLEEGHNQ